MAMSSSNVARFSKIFIVKISKKFAINKPPFKTQLLKTVAE